MTAGRPRPRRRRRILAALLVVVAVLAPWIAPHDPEAIDSAPLLVGADAGRTCSATDALGRDVLLARALRLPRLAAGRGRLDRLAAVVGIPLGLLAGYRGGRVDLV